LKIEAIFVTSAAAATDLPRDGLAEIALVGRSNVGKSSLINALVRQRVARTSGAPGKTRLANLYHVSRGTGEPFYLVDLPGYGYARGGTDAALDLHRRMGMTPANDIGIDYAAEVFISGDTKGAVNIATSLTQKDPDDLNAWLLRLILAKNSGDKAAVEAATKSAERSRARNVWQTTQFSLDKPLHLLIS
jgi:hypothetical protein